MYICVDIGGTKTLFALFEQDGTIKKTHKISTNPDYSLFLSEVSEAFHEHFSDEQILGGCCAAPGKINHADGSAIAFGNLDWHNVPIRKDLSDIFGVSLLIENDAKLAGLSEALRVSDTFKKVLYITVSTGIGGAVITNGEIDDTLEDTEPGHMLFEHEGKLMEWEKFASGKAIVARFGKIAAEIDDPAIWQVFARDFALGIFNLIATIQPDVVIIGGGVGSHFAKYGLYINHELSKFDSSLVPVPPVVGAQHAEEAVIYGCYEYIKQH